MVLARIQSPPEVGHAESRFCSCCRTDKPRTGSPTAGLDVGFRIHGGLYPPIGFRELETLDRMAKRQEHFSYGGRRRRLFSRKVSHLIGSSPDNKMVYMIHK